MTVSMTLAMMGLVAMLAALCGLLLAVLRRQPALAWLGIALVSGLFESFALDGAQVSELDAAFVFFSVPFSYYCVGQSIRAAYGAPPLGKRASAAFILLIGSSIALHFASAPPVLQTLGFQLAGTLSLIDMTVCLWRRKRRNLIDSGLLAVLACLTLVFVGRIPFFPILIDQPTPFADFAREDMQGALVAIFAVLVPACVFLIIARVVTDAIETFRARAERDYLTDLSNRRRFEDFAERGRSSGGTLILCDIDKFKSVNDRFGHSAGDEVIRAFAQLIEGRGMAARIGGEEFAIWLEGVDLEEARAHADSLRREFSKFRLIDIDDHPMTASFGLAGFGPRTELDLVMAQADAALYRAKNGGRNRVAVFGEGVEDVPAGNATEGELVAA